MDTKFILSLRKMNDSLEVKVIHDMRKEVKRMRTYFKFLEKSFRFDSQESYSFLENVFKNSGMMRELQLNLMNIKKYEIPVYALNKYGIFLKEGFSKSAEQMRNALIHFDNSGFREIGIRIKTLGKDLSKVAVRDCSIEYIIGETKRINSILSLTHTEKNMHKARKHFKNLVVLCGLLHWLKPVKRIKDVSGSLKNTEEMLGEWHDKTVLVRSLKTFLACSKKPAESQLLPIRNLVRQLGSETKNSVNDIVAKTAAALLRIKVIR